MKTKISELKKEKNTLSGQLNDQAKELNERNQKCERAENEVVQLKHQKTGLQENLLHLQNSYSRLAEDIPDGANAIHAKYIIKYDIDEDEDKWTMPLLKDLKKGDLIVL